VDPVRLDEALDSLMDSALARLIAHAEEGGLLDGIQYIERGDRTNRSPSYPAMILTAGIATPVESTTWTVKYDVPLRLWAQVYTPNPAEGEPAARQWAAKGFHALLRDSETGEPGVATLPGSLLLRPGNFEPPGPGVDEYTYVGRAMVNARVQATF
jgi:hypothetical protein